MIHVIHLIKYPIIGIIVFFITYILMMGKLNVLESIFIGIIALVISVILDENYLYFFETPHPIKLLCPKSIVDDKNVPYHFIKNYPKEPIPTMPHVHPYSEIHNIKSRWMNWTIPTNPLNQNTSEYMIYPGYYSNLIVRPGFHENIMSSNYDNLIQMTPNVWANSNLTYQGTSQLNEPHEPQGPQEPHEMVGGSSDDEPRLTNVVYSGDLIEISSENNVMQRETNNSQVIMDIPLPQTRTNLSKLRFENLTNGTTSPIKYRENIYIKHNALIDNKNQTRLIKYGERVQSHQEGQIYELFKLFNKDSMDSNDYVKYGDNFLIACGDQNGDKVYLKLEGDKSISSQGTSSEGIIFNVALLKPFEPFNLCVCPNETIYP